MSGLRIILIAALLWAAGAWAGPLPLPQPDLQFDTNFVTRVAPLPDGGAVFSGSFSTVNGLPRPGLARLSPDQTLDAAWAPSFTGGVQNIQTGAGDWLYVAATNPGRIIRVSLVTAQVDPEWMLSVPALGEHPNFAGLLVDEANDALYVGVPNGVAKYLISTQQPAPGFTLTLAPPNDFFFICGGNTAYAAAIARDELGRVYVGGYFVSANGVGRYTMVRIHPDTGTVDAGWSPGGTLAQAAALEEPKLTGACSSGYDKVFGLAYGNGFLYAAGTFTIGDVTSVARFATAGPGAADPAFVSPYS
jgi:hypothetical protein